MLFVVFIIIFFFLESPCYCTFLYISECKTKLSAGLFGNVSKIKKVTFQFIEVWQISVIFLEFQSYFIGDVFVFQLKHCLWKDLYLIQLFRERLSYKRGKAYATIRKLLWVMVVFTVAWVVWAWRKETAQTRVFVLSLTLLLNHLKPQESASVLVPYPPSPPPLPPQLFFSYCFPRLASKLTECLDQLHVRMLDRVP